MRQCYEINLFLKVHINKALLSYVSHWKKGNNLIILARESLVRDIPAGDGKSDNLYFTVYAVYE